MTHVSIGGTEKSPSNEIQITSNTLQKHECHTIGGHIYNKG